MASLWVGLPWAPWVWFGRKRQKVTRVVLATALCTLWDPLGLVCHTLHGHNALGTSREVQGSHKGTLSALNV